MSVRAQSQGRVRKQRTHDRVSGKVLVLEQELQLEHRLAITNLATETSNAAVVVWRGIPRPDGWEYGVELVAPEMDFWGLEL